METAILIAQIVISILLMVFILLQQRGTAMGSAFGGGSEGFYSTRRGTQKKIYWAAIVCGILFILLAIANLFI
ncbi:MAG: preprotein translocase subunit SecG [Patescibacteria group bacterium]|nr:preprotein translocase subunit SecG [Patescibacteria group bacterium]